MGTPLRVRLTRAEHATALAAAGGRPLGAWLTEAARAQAEADLAGEATVEPALTRGPRAVAVAYRLPADLAPVVERARRAVDPGLTLSAYLRRAWRRQAHRERPCAP